MSLFSEALKKHIKHSNIPIQSLAKLSGVGRSHIQKMIKGDRAPADKDVLSKLIPLLMLTPEEISQLWKLYRIARMGDGVYERHLLVKDFIESIGSIFTSDNYSVKTAYAHDLSGMPDINVVYGVSNVNNILKAIVENEASKSNGHIKMILQPDYPFLIELLTSIGRGNKSLSISHVLVLKRNLDRSDEVSYNIQCIKNIAPLLISGCLYSPMFHYEDIGGSANSASILPNMLITEHCVINIACDMSYATIFRTSSLMELYLKIYDDIHSLSTPLITRLGTPLELLMHYHSLDQILEASSNSALYSFFPEPCLALFFNEDFIKKYMMPDLPDREQILECFAEKLMSYYSLFHTRHQLVSYFSEHGIDSFVSTGRVTEIPSEYYLPFERKDCLRLLEAMQQLLSKGNYCPVIMDERRFKMPKNLVITSAAENGVSMIHTHPIYGTTSFAFNEKSISYSLHSFMVYLKNSDLVLSAEDSNALLQRKLGEYRALG